MTKKRIDQWVLFAKILSTALVALFIGLHTPMWMNTETAGSGKVLLTLLGFVMGSLASGITGGDSRKKR